MRALLRLPTPIGWMVLALAAVLTTGLLGRGLGLRWDPFDLSGRRLRAAETQASMAQADADARRFETEESAAQARRLEHFHRQAVAVAQATAQSTAQARSAPDASTPLDTARAGRLLRHDRELCRLAPAACDPAATDAAGGGDQTVRSRAPA